MAERQAPGIGLSTEWDLGSDGWKPGMDDNFRKLSVLVSTAGRSITQADLNALSNPAQGDCYLIADGTNANKIAMRDQGNWVYYTIKVGQQFFGIGSGNPNVWDGTALRPLARLDRGQSFQGAQEMRGLPGTTVGFTVLQPGADPHPGYLAYHTKDGTRRGYTGWLNDKYGVNKLVLTGENGWKWGTTEDFYAMAAMNVWGPSPVVDLNRDNVGSKKIHLFADGALALTDAGYNRKLQITDSSVQSYSYHYFTGGLEIQRAGSPEAVFHWPGVSIWRVRNANDQLQMLLGDASKLSVISDGNLWTPMFGYLSNYVPGTASSYAQNWGDVRIALANLPWNELGSYVLGTFLGGSSIGMDTNVAGSQIERAGFYHSNPSANADMRTTQGYRVPGATLPGTWKAMFDASSGSGNKVVGLWKRVG